MNEKQNREFSEAFDKICQYHGVKAAYLARGRQREDGMVMLIVGGDQEVSGFMSEAIRQHPVTQEN